MKADNFSQVYDSTGKILEDAEGFGLFTHISDLDVAKSQWIMAIHTVLNDIPKKKMKAVFRKNKIKFNYLAFVSEITPHGKRRYSKEELAELEREATIADYRNFYESIVMIANDMASVDVTCPDEEVKLLIGCEKKQTDSTSNPFVASGVHSRQHRHLKSNPHLAGELPTVF